MLQMIAEPHVVSKVDMFVLGYTNQYVVNLIGVLRMRANMMFGIAGRDCNNNHNIPSEIHVDECNDF